MLGSSPVAQTVSDADRKGTPAKQSFLHDMLRSPFLLFAVGAVACICVVFALHFAYSMKRRNNNWNRKNQAYELLPRVDEDAQNDGIDNRASTPERRSATFNGS